MITAQQINKKIREAIRKFGEYNYFDKGAYEVMDLIPLKAAFKDMSAKEVADVLDEVSKLKRYGLHFVQNMVCYLDDREDFDELMEDKRLEGMY